MTKRFNDARDWFFEKKFGFFIHWGLYAINAWHEQEQMRRGIPRSEYEKLIHQFNPKNFNPDHWLDLAEQTGMKYLCVTTKHHDGFCLWDTKQTDFNVMNSPYHKDILAMIAEACHRRDFPLCLYYSVVDWHHPNYPNCDHSHELPGPEPGDEPDLEKYLNFLKSQVKELCTDYGVIHGFWWDINQTGVKNPSINKMIRDLQPQAVINNRGFDEGDFGTPERDWNNTVETSLSFPKPTEAYQSVGSESWGYRTNESYFTSEFLIRAIDSVLAKGDNYLLNAGPKADGTFPDEAVKILKDIGAWIKTAWESIEGTEPCSNLVKNRNILLTRKDKEFYIHLNKVPVTDCIILKPMNQMPLRAILLNDGSKVNAAVEIMPNTHKEKKAQLYIDELPIKKFRDTVMIVKLKF